MGAFVQTSNFQWSDKTRKFLTKTGQRELSEWLSYMDFHHSSEEEDRLAKQERLERKTPTAAELWHAWTPEQVREYLSWHTLRLRGDEFDWVPGGQGRAHGLTEKFMETINYITDGNYHEDRQPDINAYPFSLLHLGELRRSEIWDAATRRFETAGGTFGTWLTETRAFVKLRRAQGSLDSVLRPLHTTLTTKEDRLRFAERDPALQPGGPNGVHQAGVAAASLPVPRERREHSEYRVAERKAAQATAEAKAKSLSEDPILSGHTIKWVSDLVSRIPPYTSPPDVTSPPSRLRAGPVAVHHDRALQATETAAFYGDISFWLVGSEETPFVVFKEPNAELTQRPDWETFTLDLAPGLIQRSELLTRPRSPAFEHWMEVMLLQSHRKALAHEALVHEEAGEKTAAATRKEAV